MRFCIIDKDYRAYFAACTAVDCWRSGRVSQDPLCEMCVPDKYCPWVDRDLKDVIWSRDKLKKWPL